MKFLHFMAKIFSPQSHQDTKQDTRKDFPLCLWVFVAIFQVYPGSGTVM